MAYHVGRYFVEAHGFHQGDRAVDRVDDTLVDRLIDVGPGQGLDVGADPGPGRHRVLVGMHAQLQALDVVEALHVAGGDHDPVGPAHDRGGIAQHAYAGLLGGLLIPALDHVGVHEAHPVLPVVEQEGGADPGDLRDPLLHVGGALGVELDGAELELLHDRVGLAELLVGEHLDHQLAAAVLLGQVGEALEHLTLRAVRRHLVGHAPRLGGLGLGDRQAPCQERRQGGQEYAFAEFHRIASLNGSSRAGTAHRPVTRASLPARDPSPSHKRHYSVAAPIGQISSRLRRISV